MKKLALGLLMCFALVSALNAAPACMMGDNVWLLGVDQHYSCQLGNVLFDNFTVVGVTNDPTPTVSIAPPLQSSGPTLISFNPNESSNFNIDMYFRVTALTGAITSVDLSVGGLLATVSERVCSNIILGNPGNNCAPTGTQLAALANFSGQPNISVPLSTPSRVIYIFKDIGTQPGGALTSFSQSFGTVPEPMTISLMGAGLLGLGLRGRRHKK